MSKLVNSRKLEKKEIPFAIFFIKTIFTIAVCDPDIVNLFALLAIFEIFQI